jgi:hypothetical protein
MKNLRGNARVALECPQEVLSKLEVSILRDHTEGVFMDRCADVLRPY